MFRLLPYLTIFLNDIFKCVSNDGVKEDSSRSDHRCTKIKYSKMINTKKRCFYLYKMFFGVGRFVVLNYITIQSESLHYRIVFL